MDNEDAILTQSLTIDEMGNAIISGVLLPSQLTRAQFKDWASWEPEPVELTNLVLNDAQQREEFLWEYYWQGEASLFRAVAHVWGSLEGEREAHGTLVGLISGTGGKGKTGLIRTLRKLLRECLDGCSPLPCRDDYASLEEWNDAVRQSMVDDEQQARSLCARYSTILDGRVPEGKSPSSLGQIVQGPWK